MECASCDAYTTRKPCESCKVVGCMICIAKHFRRTGSTCFCMKNDGIRGIADCTMDPHAAKHIAAYYGAEDLLSCKRGAIEHPYYLEEFSDGKAPDGAPPAPIFLDTGSILVMATPGGGRSIGSEYPGTLYISMNKRPSPDTIAELENGGIDHSVCPNCGVIIIKNDGCNDMWCTQCHTGFHFITRLPIRGSFENPHRSKDIPSMKSHFMTSLRNHFSMQEPGIPQTWDEFCALSLHSRMKKLVTDTLNHLDADGAILLHSLTHVHETRRALVRYHALVKSGIPNPHKVGGLFTKNYVPRAPQPEEESAGRVAINHEQETAYEKLCLAKRIERYAIRTGCPVIDNSLSYEKLMALDILN